MYVSPQQRNFELALAERLGVDPKTASFEGWETNGSAGWVTLRHIIDAAELTQMWRDAAPPEPPLDVKRGDRLRLHREEGFVDVVLGGVVRQPDGSYLLIEQKGSVG